MRWPRIRSGCRFRDKYAAKMAATPDARAFEIVSAPLGTSGDEFGAIAHAAASVDTLDTFLRDMKARYPDSGAISPPHEPPPPAPPGAPSATTAAGAPSAAAAPPSAPETQPAEPPAPPALPVLPAPPARAAGHTAER